MEPKAKPVYCPCLDAGNTICACQIKCDSIAHSNQSFYTSAIAGTSSHRRRLFISPNKVFTKKSFDQLFKGSKEDEDLWNESALLDDSNLFKSLNEDFSLIERSQNGENTSSRLSILDEQEMSRGVNEQFGEENITQHRPTTVCKPKKIFNSTAISDRNSNLFNESEPKVTFAESFNSFDENGPNQISIEATSFRNEDKSNKSASRPNEDQINQSNDSRNTSSFKELYKRYERLRGSDRPDTNEWKIQINKSQNENLFDQSPPASINFSTSYPDAMQINRQKHVTIVENIQKDQNQSQKRLNLKKTKCSNADEHNLIQEMARNQNIENLFNVSPPDLFHASDESNHSKNECICVTRENTTQPQNDTQQENVVEYVENIMDEVDKLFAVIFEK